MVGDSKNASEKGRVEITKAEVIIEEIKKLLKDAEEKIEKAGSDLLVMVMQEMPVILPRR